LSPDPLTKAFQNACRNAAIKTMKMSDKLMAARRGRLLRAGGLYKLQTNRD
jgi:hypothetical protein